MLFTKNIYARISSPLSDSRINNRFSTHTHTNISSSRHIISSNKPNRLADEVRFYLSHLFVKFLFIRFLSGLNRSFRSWLRYHRDLSAINSTSKIDTSVVSLKIKEELFFRTAFPCLLSRSINRCYIDLLKESLEELYLISRLVRLSKSNAIAYWSAYFNDDFYTYF